MTVHPGVLALGAAVLAAAAGWVSAGPPGWAVDRIGSVSGGGAAADPWSRSAPVPGTGRAAARSRLRPAALAVLVVTAASLLGLGPAGLLPALVASAAGLVLVRTRRRTGARRTQRARDTTVELCLALAAELRAGAPPRAALAAACSGLAGTDRLARAARGEADVAAVLRSEAAAPGAGGLRSLAVCWAVSDVSGAPLAPAVARLADGLRADQQLRRDVDAELAGPRATARLLALLPLGGVALGSAVGGDPVGVLLGTPVGLACLVAGSALVVLGTWWTARIVARAEPP